MLERIFENITLFINKICLLNCQPLTNFSLFYCKILRTVSFVPNLSTGRKRDLKLPKFINVSKTVMHFSAKKN